MALKSTRSTTILLAQALTVLAAMSLLVFGGWSGTAQAHGSVTDPASRNYGCYERWGSHHQDPAMATEDPMCWQAFQANPNTMWNWNGLYRENLKGAFQANIPDGTLCSGGKAQSPLYDSLDAVGAWHATDEPQKFTLTLTDGAKHGADYLLIYITKQGTNTTSAPLKWSDLELVQKTPAYGTTGLYQAQVDAGNRTGRHIVYTIWQASHLDQTYFICSDVNFTGGSTVTPTTPPTTTSASPTTSVSPTVRPTTTTPTTAPTTTTRVPTTTTTTTSPSTGPSGSCSAVMRTTSSWSGGFQSEVTVTAGAGAIKSWAVSWTLASGQTISSVWNGTSSVSGTTATVRNASYNGAVDAGRTTTFGFLGTGTASTPTLSCSAA
jgi:lytic cellulose monooxygenase (C4-dehydrogenating)